MSVIAYEKEADSSKHFYFMFFKDMKEANYRFAGPHIHHATEMVFCTSGKIRCTINSEERMLDAGEILIINSYDFHFYEYVGNASCYIMVISKDYTNDVLSDKSIEFKNYIKPTEENFLKISNFLSAIFKQVDKLTFVGKKAFVLSIFSILEKSGLYRNKDSTINKDICQKIINYVEEHYSEKIGIDTASEYFGYSRNYFSSLFNKIFGETFNSFINRYRVSKVQEILNEKPDSLIEDIIYSVGFNSRETYYRCLRQNR